MMIFFCKLLLPLNRPSPAPPDSSFPLKLLPHKKWRRSKLSFVLSVRPETHSLEGNLVCGALIMRRKKMKKPGNEGGKRCDLVVYSSLGNMMSICGCLQVWRRWRWLYKSSVDVEKCWWLASRQATTYTTQPVTQAVMRNVE